MAIIPETDDYIIFKPDTHQYFRKHDGAEFCSVSSVLKRFKEPFDAKSVSERMTDSREEAEELRAEWQAINKESTDHGHMIHETCEEIVKYGTTSNPGMRKLAENLYPHLRMYKKSYSEKLLYDQARFICGTADWPALRSVTGKTIVADVNDFKTNIRKGIINYSGKIDKVTGQVKYYNKYLYPPVEHLEASNYNEYCLQLAIYAFMLELMYNVKIGALNIFFISLDLEVTKLPVPYMRNDAIAVLDRFNTLKDLNGNLINRSYEKFYGNPKELAAAAAVHPVGNPFPGPACADEYGDREDDAGDEWL